MRNDITLASNVKQHNFANIAQNDGLTMTSLEIAERSEKEHRNVMRDIRIMLVELYGEGGVLRFEHTYTNEQNGQRYPIFKLPKDLTITLVAGYSVKLRKRIIDRWLELEETSSFALPQTFAEALRALADKEERVGQLQTKINQDMPKVVFAEAVRDLDGVCSVEAIAKVLGIGRNKFFKKLREDNVLTVANLPYQRYIDRDYFRVSEKDPWIDKDGKSHPSISTVVTGRGQVWLQHKYSNNGNKV